jgi:hypothetical protein
VSSFGGAMTGIRRKYIELNTMTDTESTDRARSAKGRIFLVIFIFEEHCYEHTSYPSYG